MIKVSTKSTYAVKALIDLARASKDHPERLSEIAKRQSIPLPYLEQIFSKLKKAGVVEAARGPQGGYRLRKSPQEITLGTIITVLEGPMQPVLCSHPENQSDNCHSIEGCMSRRLCNELDGELSKILHRNTLESLCAEAERLSTMLVNIDRGRTV